MGIGYFGIAGWDQAKILKKQSRVGEEMILTLEKFDGRYYYLD